MTNGFTQIPPTALPAQLAAAAGAGELAAAAAIDAEEGDKFLHGLLADQMATAHLLTMRMAAAADRAVSAAAEGAGRNDDNLPLFDLAAARFAGAAARLNGRYCRGLQTLRALASPAAEEEVEWHGVRFIGDPELSPEESARRINRLKFHRARDRDEPEREPNPRRRRINAAEQASLAAAEVAARDLVVATGVAPLAGPSNAAARRPLHPSACGRPSPDDAAFRPRRCRRHGLYRSARPPRGPPPCPRRRAPDGAFSPGCGDPEPDARRTRHAAPPRILRGQAAQRRAARARAAGRHRRRSRSRHRSTRRSSTRSEGSAYPPLLQRRRAWSSCAAAASTTATPAATSWPRPAAVPARAPAAAAASPPWPTAAAASTAARARARAPKPAGARARRNRLVHGLRSAELIALAAAAAAAHRRLGALLAAASSKKIHHREHRGHREGSATLARAARNHPSSSSVLSVSSVVNLSSLANCFYRDGPFSRWTWGRSLGIKHRRRTCDHSPVHAPDILCGRGVATGYHAFVLDLRHGHTETVR